MVELGNNYYLSKSSAKTLKQLGSLKVKNLSEKFAIVPFGRRVRCRPLEPSAGHRRFEFTPGPLGPGDRVILWESDFPLA